MPDERARLGADRRAADGRRHDADGRRRSAGVVVFNTCAIRENADNRLYGNLGHLKPLKDKDPTCGSSSPGAWHRRIRADPAAGAVGRHRGGHPRAAAPARAAPATSERRGPQMDVREYTEDFPSALPSARDDAVPCVGVDRAWVRQRLHVLHRPARTGPPALAPDRRHPRRGPGARARGRGRGHAARAERQHLRPRRDGAGSSAPLFGELLRQVERSRASGASGSQPHPHDFTPDVIEAMAETPAVCEHIHFPLQSGSDRVLKAMRRSYRRDRYLGWLERDPDGDPRRRRLHRRHRRASPARPRRTSRKRSRSSSGAVRQRVHVPVLAAPGDAGRVFDDQVPKEVVQERFERLVELQERISFGVTARRWVRRRGAGRGRGKQGPSTQAGPAPTGSCTPEGPLEPGTFVDARIAGAAAHHLAGEMVPAPEAVAA